MHPRRSREASCVFWMQAQNPGNITSGPGFKGEGNPTSLLDGKFKDLVQTSARGVG